MNGKGQVSKATFRFKNFMAGAKIPTTADIPTKVPKSIMAFNIKCAAQAIAKLVAWTTFALADGKSAIYPKEILPKKLPSAKEVIRGWPPVEIWYLVFANFGIIPVSVH